MKKEIRKSPKWNPCSWHLYKALMEQEGTNVCCDANKMIVFSCSRHSNKTMFLVNHSCYGQIF